MMRRPKLNAAMPPRYATKRERETIRRLSGLRTQRELAGFLGRSRTFVQEWQKRLACQRKHEPSEEDKKAIIRLYQKNGQARTAKLSGIPQRAVRETLLAAGIPLHGR